MGSYEFLAMIEGEIRKALSSMFQYLKITVFNVFFNIRIDDIEDEIYREKLKIKKVSDELSDTFDDMLDNY